MAYDANLKVRKYVKIVSGNKIEYMSGNMSGYRMKFLHFLPLHSANALPRGTAGML